MKRALVIVIGAVLIAGAIGGIVWYNMDRARNAQAAVSPDDLATVTRGDLIATVSATGAIKPRSSADLAFMASGPVSEILLKRGDKVQAGQPIVKLDAGELQLSLAQADANLNLAQAKLTQLQKGGSQTAVAAAQANLTSAQAAYNKLLQPDPNDVAQAQADLAKAKAALDQAQAAYDRIGGGSNPNIGMMPQSLQLQQATLDYQKALTAYNARFKPTDAQLKAAQAQVQAAQDQLARLAPTSDDLAQAQANVDAAKAARDLAKKRLDEAVVVAPFDGTIVAMDLDKGDFVQAGKPVVTVADIDHMQITLNVDETDVPRVAVGQKVSLDLDAYPGKTIDGSVTEIAPGAATVQGVVNYEVKIDVGQTDIPIKMGMTANANVEVAHKNGILLVPNRAIRASNNKRYVTIYNNGQQHEVEVQLGLSNDQESEVISGLSEGQQVITAVTTQGLPGFNRQGGSGSGN